MAASCRPFLSVMRSDAFVPSSSSASYLALTACGHVPQPFRGAPKAMTDNPLIDIPAAMGVELLPVSGLQPETSSRLTHAVADRLMAMEIPAGPVAKPGGLGFIVSGHAGASVTSPGGEQFDVTWTVQLAPRRVPSGSSTRPSFSAPGRPGPGGGRWRSRSPLRWG